jgi:hypothetical protein
VLVCPCRDQGAKRSGVATAGSEVSFIELIGGARTGTLPSSGRAVISGSLPFRISERRRLAAQSYLVPGLASVDARSRSL